MSTHYIARTDGETCEPFEDRESAIDFLLEVAEIDDDTVVIVDREEYKETSIIDIEEYNRIRETIPLNAEITLCKDLIKELRETGACSLPTEGIVHPVFGIEYLVIDECDCNEPHIHSESEVDWCPCEECNPTEEDEE